MITVYSSVKEAQPYRLFLDDIRTPHDVGNYIYPVKLRKEYRLFEWLVCRNYQQFVDCICKRGLPTHISFDHDLADVQPTEGSTLVTASDWSKEKTGYDAAKWLCNYLFDNKKTLPICYVHSSNPVGKENIQSLLECFKNTL